MVKKSEHYIKIPDEVVKANISSDAKLLLGTIASFTAQGMPCFAGNRGLNEMMGGRKTERSIRNYLYELQQHGFLDISGKANKRRLTALKFVPIKQKSSAEKKREKTLNSTSASEIDFSFVDEDTRIQFQGFIEHCRELGKRITQKSAQAKYHQLQIFASDAYYNSYKGQTMASLRHEIIRRAVAGGYPNFAPLYRSKVKKEESNSLPNSNHKTYNAETDKSAIKRTGVKGGTKLADVLQDYKVSIEK